MKIKINNYYFYYLRNILIALAVFFAFIFGFWYLTNPNGYEVNKTLNGYELPFFKILKEKETFNLIINVPKGYDYIYFPYVEYSNIVVRSGDNLIGKRGFKDKNAHSWFTPLMFILPENADVVEIEITGVYAVGIRKIFLINENEKFKYCILKFLTDNVISISIGFLITLGILLILLSRNANIRGKAYKYFGISSIIASIWLFDLISFESFYYPIRKFFVAAAYFAFAMIINGFEKYNFSKVRKPARVIIIFNYFAGIIPIFSTTPYSLKLITNFVSIVLILDVIYLFVVVALKLYFMYNTIFFAFFALTIFHDGLSLLLNYPGHFLSPYGIISLYLTFSYNVILEYKEKTNEINILYARSIIDSLTRAYNRGILESTSLNKGDILVFIDLNKFKDINDTYGHDVGDEILKKFATIVKSYLKPSDVFIRMGGDEFLIIFRDLKDKEKVNDLMKQINEEFKNSHKVSPTISWGISEFDNNVTVDETIRTADDLMYEMKRKKRKR